MAKEIPEGYRVAKVEERGYDSPNRWWEAYHGALKIGELSSRKDAVEACIQHSKSSPRERLKELKPGQVLRHEDSFLLVIDANHGAFKDEIRVLPFTNMINLSHHAMANAMGVEVLSFPIAVKAYDKLKP